MYFIYRLIIIKIILSILLYYLKRGILIIKSKSNYSINLIILILVKEAYLFYITLLDSFSRLYIYKDIFKSFLYYINRMIS